MHRRPLAQTGCVLTARLWVCCAIAASAGLSSCGGLATDGVSTAESGPNPTEPASNPPASVRPRRETCDDNPLLANCRQPYDFCEENPQSSGCSAPDPDPPPDEPLPISAARNILLSHCGPCHGPTLTAAQASASINYIDDWSQLLDAGFIERCSPERSRVIVVMRTGDMPPANSNLPGVLDADIDVVEAAIDLDCARE